MTKLQKISQWLLNDGNDFLDALLFEAISISRRLAHLEYDDDYVAGLDAKFHVDFISPVAERGEEFDFTSENVIIEFNIERHGPIYLQYEIFSFKEDDEKIIERATLLSWADFCYMEGPSYDDLEIIRWLIKDRLMTLAEGKEITNIGLMNVSHEEQLLRIKEIQERYFNRF